MTIQKKEIDNELLKDYTFHFSNIDKMLRHIDRYGNINIACVRCLTISNYEFDDLILKNGKSIICCKCLENTCIPICQHSSLYNLKEIDIFKKLFFIHRIYLRKKNIVQYLI